MAEAYQKFAHDAEVKAFDTSHRKTIRFNISRYDKAVARGKHQYSDLETARRRAANIKHKVISELDKYLIQFESNFEARGGKVIWAVDAQEAMKEVMAILRKHNTQHVVKSKTMTTEEVEFNHVLEKNGIESMETDLGEYIVQVAGERPYHIITPVMHKSKTDIAELFHEKFQLPIDSTPQQITTFVRKQLREKFYNADVGVTGGNFLLAEEGAVCLTENEGNGLMSVSHPKVHIAIVGIEKIIPSMRDLELFWPLLSTHGTGQHVTVYNSILFGPRQEGEPDGPEEMYVILLDNNRTHLLEQKEQRRALSCIRCGACLNGCPVYKNIGGHAYGTTYSGPIGAVITPYLCGMEQYKHLSFASSLCGRCTEVCPVKINLHELLLLNRKDSVEQGYFKPFDRLMMYGFKLIMNHRWMMDFGGGAFKNIGMRMFFRKLWGKRRTLPHFEKRNFRQQWIEKKK